MIDLNTNIYYLDLPREIEYKLTKLWITKMGMLIQTSPLELEALGLSIKDVNIINNHLNDKGLSFIDDLTLNQRSHLIKFNYSEYLSTLDYFHNYDFKLRYNDKISIVKPLYYLYRELGHNLDDEDKIKLNNYLSNNNLSIKDLLAESQSDEVKLITDILGLSNDNSFVMYFQNVETQTLNDYETLANTPIEQLDEYLKEKSLQKKKNMILFR